MTGEPGLGQIGRGDSYGQETAATTIKPGTQTQDNFLGSIWSAALPQLRADLPGESRLDVLVLDRLLGARIVAPTPSPTPTPGLPDMPERCACPAGIALFEEPIDVSLTRYICSWEGLPSWGQAGYCGATASGVPVSRGSAACGFVSPTSGIVFTVVGDQTGILWRCEDTGYLAYWQVDLWFYDWAEAEAWSAQQQGPWWQIRIVTP